MDRRGVQVLPWVIVLLLTVLMGIDGAIYVKKLADIAGTEGGAFYTEMAAPEGVIDAPCATKTRGVFYRSSIVSGEFRCLPVQEHTTVFFGLPPDQTYAWKVSREDGRKVVRPPDVKSIKKLVSSEAPVWNVTVYDARDGSYTTAVMGVASR